MSLTKSYQCKGQLTLAELFPDSWFGRTSPEHSAQTVERTSEPCLKKQRESKIKMPLFLDLRGNSDGLHQAASWVTGGPLLGEYTMHSFGECPSEEKESHLSQILQGGAAPEILFERKGLPGNTEESQDKGQTIARDTLQNADEASRTISFQERAGCDGGGKGILIQHDRVGALSTVNNQSVLS